MNRVKFIKRIVRVNFFLWVWKKASALIFKSDVIKVRLLRHATLVVEIEGRKILVDPFLSKKDALDPVSSTNYEARIPMVDLPISEKELEEILKETDIVLVTHTHRDHWDVYAQEKIDKNKLILCQPADEEKIRSQGFKNVKQIDKFFMWHNIAIHRTRGQHGTGEVGRRMGPVSGFVLKYKNVGLYIAGDTIWCKEVQDAINTYDPNYMFVNGGGARFKEGDPITMTADDVIQLSHFTNAQIYVVHLETVNHCYQRRIDFKTAITQRSLASQVYVPNDGEWMSLS